MVESNVNIVRAYDRLMDNLNRIDTISASMSTVPQSFMSRSGRRCARCALCSSIVRRSRPAYVPISLAGGTYSGFRRDGWIRGRGRAGVTPSAADCTESRSVLDVD